MSNAKEERCYCACPPFQKGHPSDLYHRCLLPYQHKGSHKFECCDGFWHIETMDEKTNAVRYVNTKESM